MIDVVLSGIGGMGGVYVSALLDAGDKHEARLVGAVDPQPERCPRLGELRARGVPLFPSLETFYHERRADLAVISSPIHFHAAQTRLALSRGSFVLCEKPAAATIQDVRAMQAAEAETEKWTAVGFQWSFSPAIQALKKDILSGDFGRPRRLKCLYLWPRDDAYFRRSDWAGKQHDGRGNWILDSPAQNAMAHDLHNMFYVLGQTVETNAFPAQVEAELFRIYPIENFDTAAMRCLTTDGVEILFLVSHASLEDRGPIFRYEFEKAVVACDGRGAGVRADLADGSRRDYGDPDTEPMAKLWQSIEAARNGGRPVCGLQAASSQVLCLNGAQESMPRITGFPETSVRRVEDGFGNRLVAEGLDEAFEACFERSLLPSELGAPWARQGLKISLDTYTFYPSFPA
jgi:predicted dehydrogenase